MNYWRALGFVTASNSLTCTVTFSDGSRQQSAAASNLALTPSAALYVDFGEPVSVSAVSFLAAAIDDWPTYAIIQNSVDGIQWQTALVADGIPYPGVGNTQTVTLSPVTGLVGPTPSVTLSNPSFVLKMPAPDAPNAPELIALPKPLQVRTHGAGTAIITGTVSAVGTSTNTPLSRPVVLMDDGMTSIIDRQQSNEYGEYAFRGLQYGAKYVVIAKDTDGLYRPVAADGISPKA